jgi:hypothetical protein
VCADEGSRQFERSSAAADPLAGPKPIDRQYSNISDDNGEALTSLQAYVQHCFVPSGQSAAGF